ncbi:MAG: ferredoxin, partial [Clostridia bacterium]|nr:ferredoxin [Clostridia bacterium]
MVRDNNWTVRCVFARKGEGLEILDLLDKDDTSPICGVAVDIGTTTVTCCLVDLETGKLQGKASAG